MIFKVEKLEPNVHIIRGYRKKDDTEYCFVCTLHKAAGATKWQILGAMSDKGVGKEVVEVLKYLKNYPFGTWTYVTKKDFKRFYKRFCKQIDFGDCKF